MRTRYLHTREKMDEAPAEFFVVHTDGIRKYGEVVKRAKKMTVDRPKHGKKRPSAACRRLDFGETEPCVLLSTPGESELFLLHGSFSVVEKKPGLWTSRTNEGCSVPHSMESSKGYKCDT